MEQKVNNEKDINKSSNIQNSIEDILSSIFYRKAQEEVDYSEQDFQELIQKLTISYYPIIKSSENIPILYDYLMSDNENKKSSLLNLLTSLFTQNTLLIPLFEKSIDLKRKSSLYSIGIKYYLNLSCSEDKEIIESYFNLLQFHISLSRKIVDEIYQNLSDLYKNHKDELKENFIIKHIDLLSILFKDIRYKEKVIKNYMYFHGLHSSLELKLNKFRPNPYIEFPKISNGISISFWFNINGALLDTLYQIDPNTEICLFNINLLQMNSELNEENNKYKGTKSNQKQDKIRLTLIPKAKLGIEIFNKKWNLNFENFSFNKWNNLTFTINKPKTNKFNSILCLYINFREIFTEEFKRNGEYQITKFNFFTNFIGMVTSIMVFFYEIDNRFILSSLSKLKFGIYKSRILYKIMRSAYNNYLGPSDSTNINLQKSKNQMSNNEKKGIRHCISSTSNLDSYDLIFDKCILKSESQNNLNNFILLAPFSYTKINNTIDDIGSSFIGYLSENDGSNVFEFYNENITLLGGINNLLPILEILINSDAKHLITEDVFYIYMNLILKILHEKNYNIIDANNSRFFIILSLFIEHFPSDIFTRRILDTFLDITTYFVFNKQNEINDKNNFINSILINEKILTKFTIDDQINIWENLLNCFNNVKTFILIKHISMTKLLLFLKYYDKEKNNKFCCEKHSELLSNTNKRYIMKPKLLDRVESILQIIYIIFMHQSNKENINIDFIKSLTYDFSPCLQKQILILIYKYFSSSEILNERKSVAFDTLLKNQFLNILIYIFNTSLLDVKNEVMKLFKMLIENFSVELSNFFSKSENSSYIYLLSYFIQSNIFPYNLKVYVLEEKIKLINVFFEKESFMDNLDEMWKLLKEMRTCKNGIMEGHYLTSNSNSNNTNSKNQIIVNNNTSPQYLQIFVIESLINLCCHIKNYKYIEDMCYILTDINNHPKKFLNIEDFYTNDHIYEWIVETYFLVNGFKVNYDKKYQNIFDNSFSQETYFFMKMNFEKYIFDFVNYDYENNAYNVKRILLIYQMCLLLRENNENDLENLSTTLRNIIEILIKDKDITNIAFAFRSKIAFEYMFFFNNYEILKEGKKINLEKETKGVIYKFLLSEQYHPFNTFYKIENSVKGKKDKDELKINDTIIITSTLSQIDKNDLKSIWKNYNIFSYIINHYSHMWNMRELCKMVDLKFNEGDNDKKFSMNLIKQFGSNKKMKNLLYNYLLELEITNDPYVHKKKQFSVTQESESHFLNFLIKTQNKSKTRNVIYEHLTCSPVINIILILYSISIDIAKKSDEKEKLLRDLHNLVAFLILSTVNIYPNLKNYTELQRDLSYLIRFGLIILLSRKEELYNSIIENYIMQIMGIKLQSNRRSGIKGLFITGRYELENIELLRHYDEEELTKKFSGFNDNENIPSSALKSRKYTTYSIDNIAPDNNFETVNIPMRLRGQSIHTNLRYESKDVMSNSFNLGGFRNIYSIYYVDEIKKIKSILFYGKKLNQNNEQFSHIDVEKKKNFLSDDIIDLLKQLEKKEKNFYYLGYLENYKKKRSYIELKKKLFSWNGSWSDRKLFYENVNNLKVKICNHLTRELVKPLLVPILDIDLYLPDYTKFDIKRLFLKDDENKNNNKIDLNIEGILGETVDNNLRESENKEDNQDLKFSRQKKSIDSNDNLSKTYLSHKISSSTSSIQKTEELPKFISYKECTYKFHYPEIYYFIYSNKSLTQQKFENNFLSPLSFSKINDDFGMKALLIDKKLTSSSPTTIMGSNSNCQKNYFRCCMVTESQHIIGLLSIEDDRINFSVEISSNEINTFNKNKNGPSYYINNYSNKSDPNINEEDFTNNFYYDDDRETCFGSIFKNNSKNNISKLKLFYKIKLKDIYIFFKRFYFYQENSIEIFTYTHKNYFFTFPNESSLKIFIPNLLKQLSIKNEKFDKLQIENESKTSNIIGYVNSIKNKKKIKRIKDLSFDNIAHSINLQWKHNSLSNLHYLMLLNIISNRSYKDLTQYPVTPWIIKNYKSKILLLEDTKNLRDLSLPMGMMELNEKSQKRKDLYIDHYETMKVDYQENIQEIINEQLEVEGKNNLSLNEINLNIFYSNPMAINQKPFFYGSHYSNSTYVSHYLVRLFPYANTMIEIQGNKFDEPDRLFMNIANTFKNCTEDKVDVRELTPEFYYLPEMFLNINRFQLVPKEINPEDKEKECLEMENNQKETKDNDNTISTLEDNKEKNEKPLEENLVKSNESQNDVPQIYQENPNLDVILPDWSNKSPYEFVTEMRRYLESDQTSKNLPKWIDLIFGSNQKGEKAEKLNNLFMASTYERSINFNRIKDKVTREAILRLVELGITPNQILFTDSINKKAKYLSNNFCEYSQYQKQKFNPKGNNDLLFPYFTSYKKSYGLLDLMKSINNTKRAQIINIEIMEDDNKVLVLSNSNTQYTFKLSDVAENSNNLNVNSSSIKHTNKIDNCYIFNYQMSSINPHNVSIIYNKGLNILRGGFWDGRIEVTYHNPLNKVNQVSNANILQDNDTYYLFNSQIGNSPVTYLAINEDEDTLIAGRSNGIVTIYDIDKENKSIVKFSKFLYNHYEAITCIFINNILNMFATSSYDGYINIYTMPFYKMVRSLKVEEGNYAKQVLLANSPLHCIIIFTDNFKFKVYSINGQFIHEIKYSCDIYSPILSKSHNFEDFIIYGNEKGNIVIRDIPELRIIKEFNVFDDSPVSLIKIGNNQKLILTCGKDTEMSIVKDFFVIKETNGEDFKKK